MLSGDSPSDVAPTWEEEAIWEKIEVSCSATVKDVEGGRSTGMDEPEPEDETKRLRFALVHCEEVQQDGELNLQRCRRRWPH